ncbi:MAG: hypothetical protein ABEJ70_00110 [Halobacteriaceae archaeon]
MLALARRERNAALAAAGGLLWAVAVAVRGVAPGVGDVAVAAPPLAAFGLLELRRQYGDRYGVAGHTGVALLAAGLAAGFLALLLDAFLPDAIVKLVVVGIPLVTAVACLAAGSPLVGWALVDAGVLSRWAGVAFALAVPASAVVNASLTPVLGVGLGVYGLAWAGLATRLWGGPDAGATVAGSGRGADGVRSVAGAVGLVLLAAELLALAASGSTPLFGDTRPLDGGYALLGLACLVAAVLGRRPARAAATLGGAACLAVAAAILGAYWGHLQVSASVRISQLFVLLPVGVTLAVAGLAGGSPPLAAVADGDPPTEQD